MKHTKGPWDVDPNDEFTVTADRDGLSVCCTEYEDRGKNENIANARLIAAAPELLEACQTALITLNINRRYIQIPKLQEALRKAVDKANGLTRGTA